MKNGDSAVVGVYLLTLLLSACGGGEPTSTGGSEPQDGVAAQVMEALPDMDPHALTVWASVYDGTAELEVSVDGRVVGRATLVEGTFSYPFRVDEELQPGARIDVAVLNENHRGIPRVSGIMALGHRLYEASFDRGELDGNDVVRGTPYRPSPGTWRYKLPGETSLVTVWAQSVAPDDAGQRIELWVDGRPVGQRQVVKGPQNPPPPRSGRHDFNRWHNLLPYVYAVPFDIQPGTRLDLVYENANTTEDLGDRYVIVDSVQVKGRSFQATEFDRGPLDGLDLNPQDRFPQDRFTFLVNRGLLAWTGTARFVVPDDSNALMVQARGESAGGEAPLMTLMVDGQVRDRIPVKQARFSPYRVVLSPAIDREAEVQISYVNDAVVDGVDRNLFISQLTMQDPRGYENWLQLANYHVGPVLGVDVRSLWFSYTADMYWTGTVDFMDQGFMTRASCRNSVDRTLCRDWMAEQKRIALEAH